MKIKFLILYLFFQVVYSGFSQLITTSISSVYERSKPIVQIKNGMTFFEATVFAPNITYEHVLNNKKISLFTSFCSFDGFTFIVFEHGGYVDGNGNSVDAYGFSGITVQRFDFGFNYNFFDIYRKLYLKPLLGVGLQFSRKKGNEIGNLLPINGPNYFQIEPIIALPLNTTQFVPSIGFKTGFVFWKRLDLSFGFQGVLGHKAYQKLSLKYQYKGIPQKTGEFESNGTGIFVTLGVGYRFVKFIKK
jgi:hypothetical protein